MSRHYVVTLLLIVLIGISTGCRNPRCWGPCNNGYGGYLSSTTLPSPATGTLQIPSISQGQPYYNPNGNVPTTASQPSYMVNPNSQAPTPANGAPTLAPQPGWRPVGSLEDASGGSGMQSVLQPGNTPANTQPSLAPQRAPNNFASNSAQPGFSSASTLNDGLSFKDSVNYQTTQIDERRDETRLPVTDATGVRAPSGATNNQLARSYPIYGTVVTPQNGSQFVQAGQPYVVPQGYVQPQLVQPSRPATIAGTVEYGAPGVVYEAYPASYSVPGQATVAQSTAIYDPQNSSNYQAGWRDRELTARR